MRAFPASALASRRGLREDQRREALPLAGCRPRGRSARKLRHEAARQEGSVEIPQEIAEAAWRSRKRSSRIGLASYGAALKVLGAIDKRETGRWLNNRAENSHQPFRRRERAMLRFRRMRSLQKFAAVHGSIHNHFNQERTLTSRAIFKERRTAALTEWRQLCAA